MWSRWCAYRTLQHGPRWVARMSKHLHFDHVTIISHEVMGPPNRGVHMIGSIPLVSGIWLYKINNAVLPNAGVCQKKIVVAMRMVCTTHAMTWWMPVVAARDSPCSRWSPDVNFEKMMLMSSPCAAIWTTKLCWTHQRCSDDSLMSPLGYTFAYALRAYGREPCVFPNRKLGKGTQLREDAGKFAIQAREIW